MLIAEIRVRGGGLRVEVEGGRVLLSAPGRWRQTLTLRQTVELAEALDEAGTRR